MIKKCTIPITIMIIGLGAIFGLSWKKGASAVIHQSSELIIDEEEKQALNRIKQRFSSELLTTLSFESLFKGNLFAKDFFVHPERWGLLDKGDADLISKLDKEFLRRYVTAKWNFTFYTIIYSTSHTDWVAKKPGPIGPPFVEDELKNISRSKSRGTSEPSNVEDIEQRTSHLENLNVRFKKEIEHQSLIKAPAFLIWLERSAARSEEITKKMILQRPIFGLSPGTMLYVTSYSGIRLVLIKTNNGFEIVAMSGDTV